MNLKYSISVQISEEVWSDSTGLIPMNVVSGFALLLSHRVESLGEENDSINNENTNSHLCVLLGVPGDVKYDELEAFLGPYGHDIERILVVRAEGDCTESMLSCYVHRHDRSEDHEQDPQCRPDLGPSHPEFIISPQQDKQQSDRSESKRVEGRTVVLLWFRESSARSAFMGIYSGLGFPRSDRGDSLPGSHPCLALPAARLSVSREGDSHRHSYAVEGGQEERGGGGGVGEDKEEAAAVDFLTRLHMGEGTWTCGADNQAPLTQFLPTCALCLSRIDAGVTGVCQGADARLALRVAADGEPTDCFVCRADYPSLSQGAGSCVSCGLRDNLWACLICGHLGCGRYTSQHARLHFQAMGHSFSLELATGRVWDYDRDTFVHNVELQKVLSARDSSYSTMSVGGNTTDRLQSLGRRTLVLSDANATYAQETCGHVEWYNALSVGAGVSEGLGRQLDGSTHDKLQDIVSERELILARQLDDQALHYERLLAREARHALERKHQQRTGRSVGGEGTSQAEDQPCVPRIDGAESEEFWRLKYAYATTPPEDVAQIESLKTEISLLEQQFQGLTQETAEMEREHAAVKRRNDSLLRQQRATRDAVAALDARALELETNRRQEAASLREQIRDIEFYLSAQREVDKEGGAGASMLITEKEPVRRERNTTKKAAQAGGRGASNSNSGSSGSGGGSSSSSSSGGGGGKK